MARDSAGSLDEFDRRILRLVQVDNQMPQREIAEQVGLSSPAVARRLQHLRESKVIRRDLAVLDEMAVERPLMIIVQVTTENERLDLLDGMKDRFQRCPQVQQCYYVTGEMDFILILNVKNMTEYNTVTRSLFFEGGNVKNFRTCVSMENVKTFGPIPI
jgi:Lrp/AsnC family leucine-responsive transcriptional regulator